jgi:hypothetical protein
VHGPGPDQGGTCQVPSRTNRAAIAAAASWSNVDALVAARGADIPAAQRGGNILGLRPGHVDRAAAVALVPSVRAAYERTARGAPDRG